MWKKILALTVALSLFSSGVFAGTVVKQYKTPRGTIATVEKVEVHKGRMQVTVEGKKVKEQAWYADGVTYVPLRAVSEALGADVNYDTKTRLVDITLPEPEKEIVKEVVKEIVYVDSNEETYDGKYYDIVYPKSLPEDLKEIKSYSDEAITLGKKLYEDKIPNLEQVLVNKKLDIKINLLAKSNTMGKQDAINRGKGGAAYLESSIDLFAPSINNEEVCCTNHNEKSSSATIKRLVIHEVLHSFQMYHQELSRNKSGWFPDEQPSWLKEGAIEYFAMKHSNELSILQSSIGRAKDYKFYKDSLNTENPYTFGALFVNFLDETYGTDTLFKYIESSKTISFDAFKEVYGMDFLEAEKKFEEWQKSK